MRNIIYTLSFTLILFQGLLQAQNENILQVQIKNIELLEGKLYLSLTSDSTKFPGGEVEEKYRKIVEVKDHEMSISFINIPDGEYAMSVIQDLNNNQELDTKKFGIPAEPFAFSNAALRKFRPPFFEQAKFLVEGGKEHHQELVLIYRKPKKKD